MIYLYESDMKKGLKIMLGWLAGMMCLPLMGQDPSQAPRGIFSVGPNKYVQFKEMNESKLMQWASIPTEDTYGWRVLTSDEWSYLLVNAAGEGRVNGNDLNALGRVNGQNGLVILPDGWVQPEGVPPFVTVEQEIGYDQNSYTSEQWAIMAASGAAFLPCEGYGLNTPNDKEQVNPDEIENVTTHGAYWAADEHSSSNAHCMRFNDHYSSGDIHDLNNQDKYAYYSVRLARTVVVLDEMDETEAFLTKLSEARTKSFALVRRTLGKDGTFYTLCLPFDVPNIEKSPLAGAEVFTFNGGTVTGHETGDEQLNLDLVPYTNSRLQMGVPYVLRWANTGERMTFLRFDGVENWAEEVSEATFDPGNENIKFHGLYPRKRIPGYDQAVGAPHYNFFLGANNTLYWPDDVQYPNSKMKGFRAYFYLQGGGPSGHQNDPSSAVDRYRNMPAVWRIQNTATDIEQVPSDKGQCTKVIKNGALFIMYKGTMYNVQGNKVSIK